MSPPEPPAARPPSQPGTDGAPPHAFAVTFFGSYLAKTKRERPHTMESLADLIRTTSAREKSMLPWCKLATFGNLRSPRGPGGKGGGSLRHNDNVLTISGCEGDYDDELMTPAEAIEKLRQAGVSAIIYTSPSHTEDTPRFRVLCPSSKELPPERRTQLVARLNGVLGGVLAPESFALSTSFYFGAVNNNLSHFAKVIEGRYIDELDELDKGAIGKLDGSTDPANVRSLTAARPDQITDKRLAGLVSSLLDNVRGAQEGQKHYTLLRQARALGGYMHLLSEGIEQLAEMLVAALPNTVKDWKAAKRTALAGLTHGARSPLPLEERPLPPRPGDRPPTPKPDVEVEAEAPATPEPELAPTDPGVVCPEVPPQRLQNVTFDAACIQALLNSAPPPPNPKLLENAGPPPPPPPPGPPLQQPQAEPELPPGILDPDAALDWLNRKYFITHEGGKVVVYTKRYDDALKRDYFERMSFEDFRRLYYNRYVQIGATRKGKPILRKLAEFWFAHEQRRQYTEGIVFDPSGRDYGPNVFNLWTGFAIKARPGSWDKLKSHMLNIMCGGDQKDYEYFLDWQADVVQHPERPNEVAVIKRGKEGCGKGIWGRAFLRLFGRHGLFISNSEHLTGRFNAHLRDVIFLFIDELFNSGDPAHDARFRSVITEHYLAIEAKGRDVVQVPNRVHVAAAANVDWVVSASLDSRRLFVRDVLPDKIGNIAYFKAIIDELENGGYEGMLHELLHRDLGNVNLRAVPVTAALQDQRKLSLDAFYRWWLDVLHRGYVWQSQCGLGDYFGEWREFAAIELLFMSYLRFCHEQREHRPLDRDAFCKRMGQLAKRTRPRGRGVIGESLVRGGRLTKKDRPRGYKLGTLATARRAFLAATGLAIAWP